MIGDPRSARGDPERLESILRELERALDGMRGWLRAQERSVSRPAHAQSIAEPGPRERDLLAVVEEILAIPASGLELPELYTLATDHVARLVGADRVMVLMAEGEHLRARSARGFRRDDLPS